MMSDESLKVLCERSVQVLLPHRHDAAPLIAEILKNRIIEKVPTSLVRSRRRRRQRMRPRLWAGPSHSTGNHSTASFSLETAHDSRKTRLACYAAGSRGLVTADLIGFRSFDAPSPKPEIILGNLADGQLAAALGILYARALLQDELTRGHFSDKLITSAWIHLGLFLIFPTSSGCRASHFMSSPAAPSFGNILKFAWGNDCAASSRCRHKVIFPRRMTIRITERHFRACSTR